MICYFYVDKIRFAGQLTANATKMESAHDVKPRLAEAASRLSSKEIPCIFCKKLWESRLTIINDKKDILGALDALGVKVRTSVLAK